MLYLVLYARKITNIYKCTYSLKSFKKIYRHSMPSINCLKPSLSFFQKSMTLNLKADDRKELEIFWVCSIRWILFRWLYTIYNIYLLMVVHHKFFHRIEKLDPYKIQAAHLYLMTVQFASSVLDKLLSYPTAKFFDSLQHQHSRITLLIKSKCLENIFKRK